MSNLAETIGDRLRQVRGDLTQVQFAQRLGADKNTVGRYERGERTPDGDFLMRIHSEFGVSIDWLLTGWTPPPHWDEDDETYLAKLDEARAAAVAPTANIEIDAELNARVVDGILRLYKDLGLAQSPMDLGRLSAKVYADLVNGFDPDERLVGLKGILSQLRRQLQEPSATDESKRSA